MYWRVFVGEVNLSGGISRVLIMSGAVLIAAGVIVRFGLGHLPGDIIIRRDNFTLYIPLGSMLIISAVITLVMSFFRR